MEIRKDVQAKDWNQGHCIIKESFRNVQTKKNSEIIYIAKDFSANNYESRPRAEETVLLAISDATIALFIACSLIQTNNNS